MATKRALIVGINEYQDETIPSLKGAERDAEEVRQVLIEQGDFEVAKGHYLCGSEATHESVQAGVSDLLWRAEASDVTLIYFSGHGFQDSYGRGYIAPWDMQRERPLVHGLEMQRLKKLALASPQKEAVVLVLDCCFAGIAADEKGGTEALDTAEKCFADIDDPDVADRAASGVFVLSSSASDQTSREVAACVHKLGSDEPHPHGAFTFHLLEGMAGAAPTREGGLISVAAIRQYLSDVMENSAHQTFQAYGSRVANPQRIILARASKLGQLSQDLDEIKKNLAAGPLWSLIVAARDLARVLDDAPNFGEAKALAEEVEASLKQCKSQALAWFFKNNQPLMTQVPKAYDDLERVVNSLCLETIAQERRQREPMLKLLVNLVRAVERDGKPEEFVEYLRIYQDVGRGLKLQPAKSGGRGSS